MATLGLFLLGVGEIKKLGGVRTHGSHVFKNSLAGSRLGPEHRCSGPVMLTQHAGTRHLPLPILVTRSTAQHSSRSLQQVPSSETTPEKRPNRPQVAQGHSQHGRGHAAAGRERREVFAARRLAGHAADGRTPPLRPSLREPCPRPSRASTYRFKWKSCTQPKEQKDLALCWPVPSPLPPRKADPACRSQGPCRSLQCQGPEPPSPSLIFRAKVCSSENKD